MQATFSHEVFADLLSTVDETLDEVSMLCIFCIKIQQDQSAHNARCTRQRSHAARLERAWGMLCSSMLSRILWSPNEGRCALCAMTCSKARALMAAGNPPRCRDPALKCPLFFGDSAAVPHIIRCTVLLVHIMPIIEREMLRPSAELLTAAAIVACVAQLSCSMSSQRG